MALNFIRYVILNLILILSLNAQKNVDCYFSVESNGKTYNLNLTALNGKTIPFVYFDNEGYQTDYIYTPCANNICCPYETTINDSVTGYFMFTEASDCYHSGCMGLWDNYKIQPQYESKLGGQFIFKYYNNPLCRTAWPNNRTTELQIIFQCDIISNNILYQTYITPGIPFEAKIKTPLACQ